MDIKEKETKIQVRFPHDVWSEVKRLAGEHQRSFNGEVIWALHAYIREQNEELVVCLAPDRAGTLPRASTKNKGQD